MRDHNKKWLISMLKTSGSRKKYVINWHYADEKHVKHKYRQEELPEHESIQSTRKYNSGKLHYGPLVRFLRSQIGNDWNIVYAEILSRIPAKLLDYKDMIFSFVADKVELREGQLWNKHTQRLIWTCGNTGPIGPYQEVKTLPHFMEFYVHPDTNKLTWIEQRAFKRITRKKE